MKLKYQREEELARGKRVSVGIDVHKESWHVTALVEGEEVFNGRLPAEYRVLDLLFKRFRDCLIKVAYEAGPCGFSLYDQLKGNAIETLVVPPSLIPIESGNKVKTDKRDSRKLASLLQKDMLKKVHVLSQEDRADRELVRTRRQVRKAKFILTYEDCLEVIGKIKNELVARKEAGGLFGQERGRSFEGHYKRTLSDIRRQRIVSNY